MSSRLYWLVAVALVALQVKALAFMGQPFLPESGNLFLWVNEPLSPENSQHIADWYTPSHIIHGLIFFWLTGKLFPKLSGAARFAIAVGIEVGWEVFENTPWLIDHYRQQALAQGYVGDSVINSVCDTLSMALGFLLAWRLPWWGSVAAAVALEALALWFIRDSLFLNIIGLIYPLDFINTWQMGR